MGAKYTPAQKRAAEKYKREKRDKLTIDFPLGFKERYKTFAASRGKSLTALIVELLEREISSEHK